MTPRTPLEIAALAAWREIGDADSTLLHSVPHAGRGQILLLDRVCGQLVGAMRILESLMHEEDRPE